MKTEKTEWKKIFKICACVFLLYLCINYWNGLINVLKTLIGASAPLIVGGVIAYIVNILMSCYEKWFFPKWQKSVLIRTRSVVCMIFAFLTAIVIIAAVSWLIIPQLISCINLIINALPPLFIKGLDWVNSLEFVPDNWFEVLYDIDWQSKLGQIAQWLQTGIGSVVNTVAKTLSTVFSGIVTAIIAFIFSIYLLLDKKKLKSQFTRLFTTYTKPVFYNRFFYVLGVLDDSFRRFIVGQVTEALILGALCTVGMLIFRFPYATMIGALIGFTALIPIAGAYIGAGVGAFMILTVSPVKALWFLLFIIILQQLEGNLIYPRVVGSSMGLPGIWVLAAVTVGGGTFGVLGMLIGVPFAAAIYRLVKEDIAKRE